MQTLTIRLPNEIAEYVETQTARKRFRSPSSYLQKLISEERKREERERIEELVLQGINSGPATPMTKQDWEDLRERARQRAAKRNGTSNPKKRR